MKPTLPRSVTALATAFVALLSAGLASAQLPAPAATAAAAPTTPAASAPAPYAPPYAPAPYPPGYYPPPPGYYQAAAPYAPPPPAEDAPASATHVGLGYKIGNGLGFLGGDLIISPIPHVVLDLQASTFSVGTSSGTATGWGVAPALQFHIREPGRSTPYVGLGYVYATLSLDNVTASGSGVSVNAGYEWKWTSGLGILVGGGICYLGNLEATDGTTTISRRSQFIPMLEAGIRFMFL